MERKDIMNKTLIMLRLAAAQLRRNANPELANEIDKIALALETLFSDPA